MNKVITIGFFGFAIFALVACEAPDHTQVRRGLDPENQDKDVRFRTTYYFRVFDACAKPADTHRNPNYGANAPFVLAPSEGARIITDSLYRFRMTGKANALANKIRFESGTLRKEEIDPFGATVAFDKKTGQPRFQSRAETESLARRADAELTLEKLLRMYGDIEGRIGKDNTEAVAALRGTIQTQIQGALAAMVASAPEQAAAARNSQDNVFARFADRSKVLVDETKQYAKDIEEKADDATAAATAKPAAGGGAAAPIKPAEVRKHLRPLADLLRNLRSSKDAAHAALRTLASTLNAGTDPLVTAELDKLLLKNDGTAAPAAAVADALKYQGVAKALITLKANPTANDTIGIHDLTYTFVAATPAAGEVLIGKDETESAGNLLAEVNKTQPRQIKGASIVFARNDGEAKIWAILADASAAPGPVKIVMRASAVAANVEFLPAPAAATNEVTLAVPSGDLEDYDLVRVKAAAASAAKVKDGATKIAMAAGNAFGTLERDLNRQLSANGSKLCGGDQQRRRGFQILGPEGWKTFDQDERLIMAMSSSAKPLIGSLTKISKQVLKQEASRNDELLPLVEEQLRISEAQRLVLGTKPGDLKPETIDALSAILRGKQ